MCRATSHISANQQCAQYESFEGQQGRRDNGEAKAYRNATRLPRTPMFLYRFMIVMSSAAFFTLIQNPLTDTRPTWPGVGLRGSISTFGSQYRLGYNNQYKEGTKPLPRPQYDLSDEAGFTKFWNGSHYQSYQVVTLGNDASLYPTRLVDPPRMIVGIFTSASSREQRQVIRETSLNFHNDMKGYNASQTYTSQYYTVCSLWEIQTKQIPLEDCLLVYVFVAAGGTEELPTMRLNHNASTSAPPMTIPGPVEYQDEQDMIFLNIKENMNEGKTPTWFRYASTILAEEERLHFDYIAKMDDDTLLFSGNWIDILERELPKPHQVNTDGLVYGGKINSVLHSWRDRSCSSGSFTQCPIIGPLWMTGPFYFLSHTLAAYTTSDVLDQAALASDEDVATATYVFSHPGDVTIVEIRPAAALMAYNYAWDWNRHSNNLRFQGVVFGHSENACYMPYGPYYKRLANVRKVWRQYIAFRWRHQQRGFLFRNLYRLEDHPALDHEDDRGNVTVHPSDYIYSSDDFDASPIVLESPYNLIFFPVTGVADVVWRCLIRRLLGFEDWDDPKRQFEGLTYLANYTVEQASAIMSSPSFVRAMFVRDPRDRIQSNYIEAAEHDPRHDMLQGCHCTMKCGETGIQQRCHENLQSFETFLTKVVPECDRPYWRPQAERMEPKYFQLLDFVGHYENFAHDAAQLLLLAMSNDSTVRRQMWIDQKEIQDVFDRLEVTYSTISSPERFVNSTKAAFLGNYQVDVKSPLLRQFTPELPFDSARLHEVGGEVRLLQTDAIGAVTKEDKRRKNRQAT